MPDTETSRKILDLAVDTRKFEIGLFWQRSLFFWGFIAASLIGYATIMRDGAANKDSALVIASFGFVCSIAWSLANRGSKYWQEYWEAEVEKIEQQALGYVLFGKVGGRPHEYCWLKPRRYSVSKLAMALSDFTIIVWVFLMLRLLPLRSITGLTCSNAVCQNSEILIPLGAACFAILMLCRCRSDPRPTPP